MGRTIIVSNRVASPRQAAEAGGVAVALADIMRGRDGIWLGWSGAIETPAGATPRIETADGEYTLMTLPLSPEEHRGYYLGYANSVLWPVFHNRVDLAAFEAGYFETYLSVNRRFAEALVPLLRPDDQIWVHDYHFIPLAKLLRAAGVECRIGFFLHIPFPPSEAFLAVPEHLRLARAFAAYDLVGLQTVTDVGHMIDYLEHGADGRLLPDGRIRVGDRIVSIASFPVGIDADYFEPKPADLKRRQDHARLRIIGVDRLDYTKGLPQKFRGYCRFLQQNTDWHGRVILTQIAAPTRESVEAYTDIRHELESLSGAINGRYGDLDWVPIHYINRSAPRAKLATTYRSARLCLVTPLRDGMNLVAKEYLAAQNPRDPGLLILSRFAGAAEQLTDALIVNPYNVDEIADAIRIGLAMPLAERRRRHARMLHTVRLDGADRWGSMFLEQLRRTRRMEPAAEPARRGPASARANEPQRHHA